MDSESAKIELLSQTAKISWRELERYFAAGKLIYVANGLDLIDVGTQLILDNKEQFAVWTSAKSLHPVTDSQAQCWAEKNPTLWACVVSPWVLVQELPDE